MTADAAEREREARLIADRGAGSLRRRVERACIELHPDQRRSHDPRRIGELTDDAVAGADPLQWRRAMMLAAADELQIGVMQASRHPAVNRALELIGVPVNVVVEPQAPASRAPAPVRDPVLAPTPLPATVTDQPDPAAADTDDRLQFTAIHVDGVIDLPGSKPIELRLSQDGLDIIRSGGAVFGRLGWSEIDELSVVPDRTRRMRRSGRTVLVLRTREGEATFEVPDYTPTELSERVGPLLTAHARRVRTRPGDAP